MSASNQTSLGWHADTILRGGRVALQPGDPDGQGAAELQSGSGDGSVCFGIEVSRVAAPPVAAHVHRAPRGETGAIVATLETPNAEGLASGCINVGADVRDAIGADPAAYYVDIHTSEYPDGAVRGQLELAGPTTGSNEPAIFPDAPPTVLPEAGMSGTLPLLAGLGLGAIGAGLILRGRGRG